MLDKEIRQKCKVCQAGWDCFQTEWPRNTSRTGDLTDERELIGRPHGDGASAGAGTAGVVLAHLGRVSIQSGN